MISGLLVHCTASCRLFLQPQVYTKVRTFDRTSPHLCSSENYQSLYWSDRWNLGSVHTSACCTFRLRVRESNQYPQPYLTAFARRAGLPFILCKKTMQFLYSCVFKKAHAPFLWVSRSTSVHSNKWVAVPKQTWDAWHTIVWTESYRGDSTKTGAAKIWSSWAQQPISSSFHF